MDVSVTIVKEIEKKEILQEVEVLELIRGHENIIGYYGAYYHRTSVKKPHYEGLWGLCHLENKKVIHHNLRPQNIILTTSADVKISK
ncbi:probable serine/threonine-protein kinase mkcA [Xenopus laevis]|uniref:Probable serine/threonine-protein kinase mkcA n=1 Tax=Xenopus laevis TaxID=8355 RepID=A0A8J1M7W0_XENLA|nr:probable serine/threonine-protein kinase mkcA [Xenopus laevis]